MRTNYTCQDCGKHLHLGLHRSLMQREIHNACCISLAAKRDLHLVVNGGFCFFFLSSFS